MTAAKRTDVRAHVPDEESHPFDEDPEFTVIACDCGHESVGRNRRQARAAHLIHVEQES